MLYGHARRKRVKEIYKQCKKELKSNSEAINKIIYIHLMSFNKIYDRNISKIVSNVFTYPAILNGILISKSY